MTKKDYIKLAALIRDTSEKDREENYKIILKEPFINRLCDILQADNPNFDRERFIKATR